MKFFQVTILFLLIGTFGKLAESQYYDSRGIWGVAIDAIVQNTRVQASAAAAQRQLIQGNFESL